MKLLKVAVVLSIALLASPLARSQESISRPANTVAQLETKLEQDPNNARLLRRLGDAYYFAARSGDQAALTKAIRNFERSIDLDPGDAAARRSLGLTLLAKIGYLPAEEISPVAERARSQFERVLEQAPKDATALSSHGVTLTILAGAKQDQRLFTQGVQEMNQAVELAPDNIVTRLNRGFVLLNFPAAVRDPNAVISDLTMVLDGLPKGFNERAQGVVRLLLGDLYLEMKDPQKAKSEYEQAIHLASPAAEDARLRLAALKQSRSLDADRDALRSRLTDCSLCHANP